MRRNRNYGARVKRPHAQEQAKLRQIEQLRVEALAWLGELSERDLLVTDLVVKTGASDTRLILPRGVERCSVRVEAGAAQVTIDVPEGVAASIRSSMGLGTTTVAEERFGRFGSGHWKSADFETAAHRVEIDVSGGVGSVRIR